MINISQIELNKRQIPGLETARNSPKFLEQVLCVRKVTNFFKWISEALFVLSSFVYQLLLFVQLEVVAPFLCTNRLNLFLQLSQFEVICLILSMTI